MIEIIGLCKLILRLDSPDQSLFYVVSLSVSREQIMAPLAFLNKVGHVDCKGTVVGGGDSGRAGAVRLALSFGLAAFEDENTKELMRQGRDNAKLAITIFKILWDILMLHLFLGKIHEIYFPLPIVGYRRQFRNAIAYHLVFS